MYPRYLVITYSTWHEDDIGPVLVYTYDYLRFYPVGTPDAEPLPIIGYELKKALPLDWSASVAVTHFYENFVPLERAIAA